MTDTTLLPCPFCGGEAGIGTKYDPDGDYAFVNCTACMASTDTLLGQQNRITEVEAIAAWNTRAAPTDTKPVAWMYEPTADRPVKDRPFAQTNRANMDPRYWTETPLYAAPQPCTDCAALDAVNAWRPMTDTAWLDGRDVVLFAHDMEIHARYCPGEWSDDTPISPPEYSGAVWSAFDDAIQFEIEEVSSDPVNWCHGPVTQWRELTPPQKRGKP